MKTLNEFVEANNTQAPKFVRTSRKGNSVWNVVEPTKFLDGTLESSGYACTWFHVVIVNPQGSVIHVESLYEEYSY